MWLSILLIAFLAVDNGSCYLSSSRSVNASAAVITRRPPLDPCEHYQLLTDATRTVDSFNGSTQACDNLTKGWYRFTGNAGQRMLDYCPSNSTSNIINRCGAEYQGWIASGAMPKTYEGVVPRLVCFSGPNSCKCRDQRLISVQNCKTFYVYKLDGVPRCSQRYCTIKEESATVSCVENYMRIDMVRKFFDTSLYSSITLRDPTCIASLTKNVISLGSMPDLCKSKRTATYDSIIYENEVVMLAKPEADGTIKEADQRLTFTCAYNKNGFISSRSFKPISSVNGNADGTGKFVFYLRMYTDAYYSALISEYPFQIKPRDYVYFEAYASVSDKKLVVLIDQCYTTPTMQRDDPGKKVFIEGGCQTKGAVQFYKSVPNKQRFSIQPDRLNGKNSAMYIHCTVFMCHRDSTDERCHSGCQDNNVKRVRRDLSGGYGEVAPATKLEYYFLEVGPIKVEEEKAETKSGANDISTTTLIMIGGIAVLVLIVAILVIIVRRRSPRQPAEKEIGLDNAPGGKQCTAQDEAW